MTTEQWRLLIGGDDDARCADRPRFGDESADASTAPFKPAGSAARPNLDTARAQRARENLCRPIRLHHAVGRREQGARPAPCAVRGFETAGGRILSVVTEKGAIKTSRAVLAGGAWSSLLLDQVGVRLPTATVFSWCASFHGVDGPDGAGYFSNSTWRRQIDGGYTTSMQIATAPLTPGLIRNATKFRTLAQESSWKIEPRIGRYFVETLGAGGHWKLDEESPFERRRILEPEPYPELTERMLANMRTRVPSFRDLEPGPAWGGAITTTPDELPIVGPVPGVTGLVVATAFDNGLAKTPAVGIAVAELINGETPRVPLHALRCERFSS